MNLTTIFCHPVKVLDVLKSQQIRKKFLAHFQLLLAGAPLGSLALKVAFPRLTSIGPTTSVRPLSMSGRLKTMGTLTEFFFWFSSFLELRNQGTPRALIPV